MVKNWDWDWEFVKPSGEQLIDFIDINCLNFHVEKVDELSKDLLM
jgi:hypothetical protein